MALLNLFKLMLVIPFTTAGHSPFYCYSNDPIRPQLERFAQLTSYDVVRGNFNPAVSSCTPSKFWFISRYGTRLPNAADITDITNNIERIQNSVINNYNAGRTSLCANDFDAIQKRQFDPNITTNVASQLTSTGWNEFIGIGRRYAEAFPTIFPTPYSPERHLFRTTHLPSHRSTLEAFVDGIFGTDAHLKVQFENTPDPNDDDLLLRPQNACPLYNEVAQNGTEHEAFTGGPEFEETLTQISEKLGLYGFRQLRREEVNILGLLCRYEQTWHMDSLSPWCGAYSVTNHIVLEYFRDLDFYWRFGYGPKDFRPLYENLNCNLMQDMLRFVTSNDPNGQNSKVYTTGTSIVPLLLVTLGAFDSDPQLNRFNFAQQYARQWRSSKILPMGTNLAVVKFSCADGDDDLLFLFNERPLQLDGCQPNGLCKQTFIIERFSRFLNGNCNEIFCRNSRE